MKPSVLPSGVPIAPIGAARVNVSARRSLSPPGETAFAFSEKLASAMALAAPPRAVAKVGSAAAPPRQESPKRAEPVARKLRTEPASKPTAPEPHGRFANEPAEVTPVPSQLHARASQETKDEPMTTLQTSVAPPLAVEGTPVERKMQPGAPEPPRFVAPRPRTATPAPLPVPQSVPPLPVAELATRTGLPETPITVAVSEQHASVRPGNQPSDAFDAKRANARTQVFTAAPGNMQSVAADTPTPSQSDSALPEQYGRPAASSSMLPAYTVQAVVPQPPAAVAEVGIASNSPQASQRPVKTNASRPAVIPSQGAPGSPVAPTTRPNPAPTTLTAAQPVRTAPVQPHAPPRPTESSAASSVVPEVHGLQLLVAPSPSPSSAEARGLEVIGTADARPVTEGLVTPPLPKTAAKPATIGDEATSAAPRRVLASAPQVSPPLQPNVQQHVAPLRAPLAPPLQDAALPDKQKPQLPFHTLGEPRGGNTPEEKQRPGSSATALPIPPHTGSVTSPAPTPAVPMPQASAVPTTATRVSDPSLLPARSTAVTSPELLELGHLGNAKIDVNNNEARVSVDTDAGALSLHVRVRQGVADVTVDGHAAAQLGAHGRDLETYLAKEGFTLGRFNVDERWREGSTVSGDSESRDPPRQGADEGDGTGHADAPTARPVSGDPTRGRTAGRLHVKA